MEGSQPRAIRDELRGCLPGAAFGPHGVAIRIALADLPDAVLASAAYGGIGEPGNGGIYLRPALISAGSFPVRRGLCSSLSRHSRTSGISRRSPL